MDAIKIVFANEKGGVGKTTSAINLSGFLSEQGYKVLAIDLDPQSHLSLGLGVDIVSVEKGVGEVLEGYCGVMSAAVRITDYLYVLPTTPDVTDIMARLDRERFKKYELLKFALRPTQAEFDFIIMDTGRDASVLLNLNGFAAADYALIPAQAEFFSTVAIRQITDVLGKVKKQLLNPDIKTLGIFLTFFQKTNNCKKYAQVIKEKFPEELMQTVIRKNTALSEASEMGMPILYAKSANGYEDYKKFTEEVLNKLKARGDARWEVGDASLITSEYVGLF